MTEVWGGDTGSGRGMLSLPLSPTSCLFFPFPSNRLSQEALSHPWPLPLPASPPPSCPLHFHLGPQGSLEIKDPSRYLLLSALQMPSTKTRAVQGPKGRQGPEERKGWPCALRPADPWPAGAAPHCSWPHILPGVHPTLLPPKRLSQARPACSLSPRPDPPVPSVLPSPHSLQST